MLAAYVHVPLPAVLVQEPALLVVAALIVQAVVATVSWSTFLGVVTQLSLITSPSGIWAAPWAANCPATQSVQALVASPSKSTLPAAQSSHEPAPAAE